MKLTDLKTLKDIEKEYDISYKTLQSRLKYLKENVDYRKLGIGQSTILTPKGVEKITYTKFQRKKCNTKDSKEIKNKIPED